MGNRHLNAANATAAAFLAATVSGGPGSEAAPTGRAGPLGDEAGDEVLADGLLGLMDDIAIVNRTGFDPGLFS